MMLKRAPLVIAVLSLGLAAFQGGSYTASVSGAMDINLSHGDIYYEYAPAEDAGGVAVPEGAILIITKPDRDDVTHVLQIRLPPAIAPGSYDLISLRYIQEIMANPAPKAGFYSRVGDQPLAFSRDVTGTLIITESGDVLSGSFEFNATDLVASHWMVTVSGTFEGVPYSATPHTPRQSTDIKLPALSLDRQSLFRLFAIGVFLLLIGLNFAIQFHVGRQVYEDQPILRSLRSTRTFIRGWRFAEPRTLMIAWSILLVVIVLWLFVLGAVFA